MEIATPSSKPCIRLCISHLRYHSAADFAQFGETSALCVNTRWNFSLMGYLTSALWGLRFRKSLKALSANFSLMRKPTKPSASSWLGPIPAAGDSSIPPAAGNRRARFASNSAMDAPKPHPDDMTTRISRALFFVILAVIIGSLAIFLILRPGHA